mgnify:CR=1 FL=1|tara:strand:+ start:235 stop:609 length:375 start_codon:yes stop_codon:yes gene_type:complete
MNIGTMVKAGEDLKKLKKKRKSETCGEQLRRMCKEIAEEISNDSHDGQIDGAARFMEGTYDIRYYINRDKQYLGAEIMVAGGGPTVWINTYTRQVEGYWGGDKVFEPFADELGLDDYCEEMYGY